MSKIHKIIAQLVSLLGFGAAVYLTRLHFVGASAQSALCDSLSKTGCSQALESPFSTLFGVPLSLLLVGIYAVLFTATLYHSEKRSDRPWAVVATFLCAIVLVGGIFLLGVMAESQSYCPICLLMDGFNLVLGFIWLRASMTHAGPLIAPKPIFAMCSLIALALGIGTGLQRSYFSESSNRTSTEATAVPFSSRNQKLTVAQCQDVELSALEISDFLCPYCKKLEHNLSNVLSNCGARVDKRFVHFPLDKRCNRFVSRDLHPGACRLAEASECARIQGKFATFAAALFAETPKTDAALWRLATEKELNIEQFKTCLSEGRTRDRVRTDIELAHRLGVRSTPTFYINGRRLEGALSKQELEAEISKALSKDLKEAHNIAGTPQPDGSWPATEPAEACGNNTYSQKKQGCTTQTPSQYFPTP